MKRKLLAVLLTCCMTAGMLAGCGGSSKEAGSAQPEQEGAGASAQAGTEAAAESTGENITIEFFNQKQEEAAQQAYRNAAEEFHKEYPNITVEINTVPDSDKVLTARMAAGDVPVVFHGKPTSQAFFEKIQSLKKGMTLPIQGMEIKEGKTSPPKRYNSGSLILAMENAGQLIEDEELRAQIKGSGIGTSATRGEILKKLFNNKYLALNKKTQIVTPTMLGEMIYDVVDHSVRSLLNPELTASWEKGLTYVADGDITSDEYMMKLDRFVSSRTEGVKGLNNQYQLRACYDRVAPFYKNEKQTMKYTKSRRAKSGTKTSAKSGSKSSGRKSTKTVNASK